MFSVYNYVKDLRKKQKVQKVQNVTHNLEKDRASMCHNDKMSFLLNSNESKRSKKSYTPLKLPSGRSSVRSHNKIKIAKMRNLDSVSGSNQRNSIQHNFKSKQVYILE
jgi:hypothetical protein